MQIEFLDREFDSTAGAEEALDEARAHGWTVISIKNDWSTVFPDHPRSPAASPDPPADRW